MSRDVIVKKMRESGCRITKQRMEILDVVLQNNCTCCKEIYAEAIKRDPQIGIATIYRMVNVLEEMGVISRRIYLCQEVESVSDLLD